ncbi:MAG: YwqG family protein [Longimicrobiales bacterium]
MHDSITAALIQRGVSAERARRLASLAAPAVHLESSAERDATLPRAASKLGGAPDLADPETWPIWNGTPLAFVAQINLHDLRPFPFCSVLPDRGLLSFFFDAEQQAWGFDPAHRGGAAVLLQSHVDRLTRTPVPASVPAGGIFGARRLTPRETITTLPALESQSVTAMGLSTAEERVYQQILDETEEQKPTRVEHQLLGHPGQVQGDMQLECQLVTNGLYCGDETGYNDARAAALGSGAASWQLLTQFDTDDDAQMMWGDCGRIYFWMTSTAMSRSAFHESWAILQCF